MKIIEPSVELINPPSYDVALNTIEITGRRFTTCSNCNGKIGPKDRYCKHCGAQMDARKGINL